MSRQISRERLEELQRIPVEGKAKSPVDQDSVWKLLEDIKELRDEIWARLDDLSRTMLAFTSKENLSRPRKRLSTSRILTLAFQYNELDLFKILRAPEWNFPPSTPLVLREVNACLSSRMGSDRPFLSDTLPSILSLCFQIEDKNLISVGALYGHDMLVHLAETCLPTRPYLADREVVRLFFKCARVAFHGDFEAFQELWSQMREYISIIDDFDDRFKFLYSTIIGSAISAGHVDFLRRATESESKLKAEFLSRPNYEVISSSMNFEILKLRVEMEPPEDYRVIFSSALSVMAHLPYDPKFVDLLLPAASSYQIFHSSLWYRLAGAAESEELSERILARFGMAPPVGGRTLTVGVRFLLVGAESANRIDRIRKYLSNKDFLTALQNFSLSRAHEFERFNPEIRKVYAEFLGERWVLDALQASLWNKSAYKILSDTDFMEIFEQNQSPSNITGKKLECVDVVRGLLLEGRCSLSETILVRSGRDIKGNIGNLFGKFEFSAPIGFGQIKWLASAFQRGLIDTKLLNGSESIQLGHSVIPFSTFLS